MNGQAPRRSPLAIVLLSLLAEEPMHPYRMQQMIKQRAKDTVANVAQRNSVYQAIDRLLRAGLIEVSGTGRDQRRPERTEYALTAAGRETLHGWLVDALATPVQEYPVFPAALSSMAMLGPEEAARALRKRADALRATEEGPVPEWLPRLFTIENEYTETLRRAELAWLDGVIADLTSGDLTWSAESVQEVAAQEAHTYPPPDTP